MKEKKFEIYVDDSAAFALLKLQEAARRGYISNKSGLVMPQQYLQRAKRRVKNASKG